MIDEKLFVRSNDVKLNTRIRGKENSDGVIVVLHGGPGATMNPLMKKEAFKLLEEEYIIIYFDQRGCGESKYDIEKKITIEEAAFDVHSIVNYSMERFSDKKIYLWGASYGGLLGFIYLRYYPNEVNKYISNCPAIYFNEDGFNKGFRMIINSYAESIPAQYKMMLRIMPINKGTCSMIFNEKRMQNYFFSKENGSDTMKHVTAMRDWFFIQRSSMDIKKIKIPVLIIIGKEDPLCDFRDILKGCNENKNKRVKMKIYENCGHEIFKDRKKSFVKDIKDFLG